MAPEGVGMLRRLFAMVTLLGGVAAWMTPRHFPVHPMPLQKLGDWTSDALTADDPANGFAGDTGLPEWVFSTSNTLLP